MAEQCCSVLCDAEATRTASWWSHRRAQTIGPRGGKRWEWVRDERISGRYCDACARRLWEGGDDVDPPFPLAKVTPLRHSGGITQPSPAPATP